MSDFDDQETVVSFRMIHINLGAVFCLSVICQFSFSLFLLSLQPWALALYFIHPCAPSVYPASEAPLSPASLSNVYPAPVAPPHLPEW